MDEATDSHVLCPACGADLSGSDRAFCDDGCRQRWREARRERYARPPGPLNADLLAALNDELRAAG
jgi:predicted nucleic acid-binding Zn ribbon protein